MGEVEEGKGCGCKRVNTRDAFDGAVQPVDCAGRWTNIHVMKLYKAGVSNSFHWRPHQPRGCLQRAKCNFRTV